MKNILLSIFLLCFLIPGIQAQDLISVSGVIVDDKELIAVPHVSVALIGSAYGTAGLENGFFSIVAREGDTLLFSSLGYVPVYLIVPDTLTRFRWSTVVKMPRDTIFLDEAIVYPWPSVRGFKQAFMAYRPAPMLNNLGHLPAGLINRPDTFYPVKPTIMNPISLIYESVVLEIINRLPKKKRARELPRMD